MQTHSSTSLGTDLLLMLVICEVKHPPTHFEELITSHFKIHAHDILSACKAYSEGAPVGSFVNGRVVANNMPENGGSCNFKSAVTRMTNVLVSVFTRYGAKDCERFILPD
ncbi:unnamed protein product [Cuscuta europaea]|uniref:Uncharacterized protein n=1 Tax=Cuscuta europaea TaxID=41803 RepID=A0A9P0Z7C9_CUSEU|nr:unnamed protein product [Cuscuta europaea]